MMEDLEKIYSLIEPDEKGEMKKINMHMYQAFGIDDFVHYYYYKTIEIEVKIPINVQMIQCIKENDEYYLHMSTSSKYTHFLRKNEREIFEPFLDQGDYDIIRGKRRCSCDFCPFPWISWSIILRALALMDEN